MDGWCAWASVSARLRADRFGYHLYTYGDNQYKLTLIDWTQPKLDYVVWENAEPMSLSEIISRVQREAVRARTPA